MTNHGKPLSYLKDHMYDGCCYPWPYAKNSGGRPHIRHEGKTRSAIKTVMELNGQPQPFPGAVIRHLCGYGHVGCFNFGCLTWGTRKEDSEDRVRHGTSIKGIKNPSVKLNEKIVCVIKSILPYKSDREIVKEVTKRFNVLVTRYTIYRIRRGDTWNYV